MKVSLSALACSFTLLMACGNATTNRADSGPSSDGGALDARLTPDAGADPLDAGFVDASTDASADASSTPDASTPTDASPDAGPCAEGPTPHVYLVGDSTTASNSGWGDDLASYLDDVEVSNTARGGRSSRSFYEEGSFDDTRDALEAGDYVFVQFGHNDDGVTTTGDAPGFEGTFRHYLERYIDEARARGAEVILLTPVSRMFFTSGGEHRRTHDDYPDAVRRVAMDHGVVLLDLEQRSHEVFQDLGPDETRRLFAEDDDEDDRTHFPPDKAFRVTEMVVQLLEASSSPLACYVLAD